MTASVRPRHSRFLRSLEGALVADAREDIELTLKVGVLLAQGYNQRQVAERLEIPARQVTLAVHRIRGVSERLEGEIGEQAYLG